MEESNTSDLLPLLKEKKERCIIEKSAEPCLVCSTPTQKLHLQVNACYACSAFYRRSLEAHVNYKCQNNNEKCDLTIKKEGKPLCRLCRYNKCVEIGMVINVNKKDEKVNKEKDEEKCENIAITDNKSDEVETIDYLSEIMNLPNIYDEGDLINMELVFDELRKIFATSIPFISENFEYTKEFTKLMKHFIDEFKPTVLLKSYGGNRESTVKRCFFINKRFFAAAKMLSKYPPFSSLSLEDKILLFCHFWNIFLLFERMYQSNQYFKTTDENDSRIQCSFDEYFDIGNLKTIYHVSIPNPTFYSLMLPMFQKGKLLISTFKKCNPKFEEFVYLCHVGLWSCHEILKISPITQTLSEQITNKVSEDLHNYYVEELRVASYSARQAQLFKLISLAEVVVRNKKQMIAGRKLFSFGPNFFPYCNFETNFFDYVDKNQL